MFSQQNECFSRHTARHSASRSIHQLLTIQLLFLVIVFVSCAGGSEQHTPSTPAQPPEPQFTRDEFLIFRGEKFPATETPDRSSLLQRYRSFYGIHPGSHTHTAGYIPGTVADQLLFLQRFTTPTAQGTIVLLHGYLEHSGNLATFTNLFLDVGWNVYTADLPGHGISTGERGWIHDFGDYADMLGRAITAVAAEMAGGAHKKKTAADGTTSGPLVLLGHSTGASTILEYLFNRTDSGSGVNDSAPPLPDRIILVAPLVRSTFWELSRIGVALAEPLPLERVRGSARAGTPTPYYLRMARLDPLRVAYTHLDWVRAMIRWNERNPGYTPLDIPSVVLQGTEDSVLDVEYNIAYLEKQLTNAKIHTIEGAHHNLHHEAEPLQTHILQLLLQSLP